MDHMPDWSVRKLEHERIVWPMTIGDSYCTPHSVPFVCLSHSYSPLQQYCRIVSSYTTPTPSTYIHHFNTSILHTTIIHFISAAQQPLPYHQQHFHLIVIPINDASELALHSPSTHMYGTRHTHIITSQHTFILSFLTNIFSSSSSLACMNDRVHLHCAHAGVRMEVEVEVECINVTSWRYRYPANLGHGHCYSTYERIRMGAVSTESCHRTAS